MLSGLSATSISTLAAGSVSSGAVASPADVHRLPGGRPARHTILVVDDEPDVVRSVKDLLRLDYRVICATDPAEALLVLQREEVHVVMSDQRMPRMTGIEFLGRLREEHPDVMRLLFTGYADIKAVVDAINHGNVYRYINKPWDPDELQATIRQACERYDLQADRRRLLNILQTKNQELETVNRGLAEANAQLRRANELKHAFIQVASHELRTPLAILQGLTRLTLNLSEASSGPLFGFVQRIDRASRRLHHLVEQLIAMLQAGRSEPVLNSSPEDLSVLLADSAEDVRPFTDLRKQTLELDIPPDLGMMTVESAKIRDSLNHLLLNAIKFTPDGGRIGLFARRTDDGGATIRVSDNGAGISPDMLKGLFEPFFTGTDVSRHSSGTYEHGRQGLGLGLALVKAFIELHGGTVTVQSEAGKGTTFALTLPPVPPPSRTGPAVALTTQA